MSIFRGNCQAVAASTVDHQVELPRGSGRVRQLFPVCFQNRGMVASWRGEQQQQRALSFKCDRFQ